MRVSLALILVLAGAAAVPLSAVGLEEGKGEGKKDAEDRLLEAELLEVSTGDLEKAKAIYQAIQADEKAPESARARALLYLARCHRKLGEIEAARKLLGDLVKNRAAEREVLRQAQSFLRELAGGRPESPDFDWLKELERNPEIQARVFDLAMDLTIPSSDAGKRAQRQLLALGSLAVPVIERVIETTRDAGHRQLLAILLLHSGRFEKLAVVFGPESSPRQSPAIQALSAFVKTVPSLPDESRARLRGSLEKLPASAEKDPWRDILLLETGDVSKLPERLRRMEGNGILDAGVLERLFAREPAAAAALAERAADPGCPKVEVRRYVDFLLEKAPEKLALPHWKGLFGAVEEREKPGYLAKLEMRGDFEVLAGLAAGGVNPLNYLWTNVTSIALRDPRWAGVLRAQKSLDRLNEFAELVDGAIPELVSALKARAKEAPEYLGKSDHLNRKEGEAWTPSPAYAEAMAGLLGEKDPVVLAIALEALALARDDSALKMEPAILKVLKATDDLHVKEFALYALLRLSRREGESGARAVQELFEEFQARSKVEIVPQAYLDSSLARLTSLGYVSLSRKTQTRFPGVPGVPKRPLPPQRILPPGPRITTMTQTLEWVLNHAGEEVLLELYPQVLSHSGTAEGAAFHEWFFLEQKDRTPALNEVLIDRLDSLSGPEIRESVIGMLYGTLHIQPTQTEPVMKFLKAAVQDPGLPTEARLKAFFWPENTNYGWLEWQRFFKSDDPLVGSFFAGLEQQPNLPARFQKGGQQFTFNFWSWVSGRPDEEKAAIQEAALKSPHEAARASAVHRVNQAEEPDFLRRALADPSPLVRSAAIQRIENTTRADAAPLVIEILGDNANRLAAIKILKRFADPRSIEPLVKLLDDPDTQVRSEARAALKEIRAALEEKREWEQVLKGLKPSPSEKPKGL